MRETILLRQEPVLVALKRYIFWLAAPTHSPTRHTLHAAAGGDHIRCSCLFRHWLVANVIGGDCIRCPLAVQASAGGAQVQPGAHILTGGRGGAGGRLYVHLPHGVPRRLPAHRAHTAHLEHLWSCRALHPLHALAAALLRPGALPHPLTCATLLPVLCHSSSHVEHAFQRRSILPTCATVFQCFAFYISEKFAVLGGKP